MYLTMMGLFYHALKIQQVLSIYNWFEDLPVKIDQNYAKSNINVAQGFCLCILLCSL